MTHRRDIRAPAPDEPRAEKRGESAPPPPRRDVVASVAILLLGIGLLSVAPSLGGVPTMVATGVGIALVVVGATLASKQRRR